MATARQIRPMLRTAILTLCGCGVVCSVGCGGMANRDRGNRTAPADTVASSGAAEAPPPPAPSAPPLSGPHEAVPLVDGPRVDGAFATRSRERVYEGESQVLLDLTSATPPPPMDEQPRRRHSLFLPPSTTAATGAAATGAVTRRATSSAARPQDQPAGLSHRGHSPPARITSRPLPTAATAGGVQPSAPRPSDPSASSFARDSAGIGLPTPDAGDPLPAPTASSTAADLRAMHAASLDQLGSTAAGPAASGTADPVGGAHGRSAPTAPPPAARAEPIQENLPDYRDPNTPIEARPGESFTITLPGNPSTGYHWILGLTPEAKHVRAEGSSHYLGGDAVTGAPAAQVFRFRAGEPGKVIIRLLYARPWEKSPPAKVRDYVLIVVPPHGVSPRR